MWQRISSPLMRQQKDDPTGRSGKKRYKLKFEVSKRTKRGQLSSAQRMLTSSHPNGYCASKRTPLVKSTNTRHDLLHAGSPRYTVSTITRLIRLLLDLLRFACCSQWPIEMVGLLIPSTSTQPTS